MTNYEKIKTISKDELASFLSEHFDCTSCPANGRNCDKANSCQDAIKKWLESEVSTSEGRGNNMTLYYVENKDGGVLCFEGTPLVCNNKYLFRFVVEQYNKTVRGSLRIRIDDYIVKQVDEEFIRNYENGKYLHFRKC